MVEIIPAQVLFNRDTIADYVSFRYVPGDGEPVWVKDEATGLSEIRCGDGVHTVDQLPALSKGAKGDPGTAGKDGAQGLPGVNAVDNDTAVAGYVTTSGSSATKVALNGAYARVQQVVSNGTDQTAAINAVLAAGSAFGTRRTVKLVGDFVTSGPLRVGSNTTLDTRDAVLSLAANTNTNMLENRATSTVQRTVTDAATTAGSSSVSSATAAFSSTDVGRTLVVAGAGGTGQSAAGPTVGRIVSVTSATTVIIDTAAITAVSGATARIYDRDSNIRISGGTWNRGSNAGGSGPVTMHTLVLRRADDVVIEGVTVTSSNAKYALSLGDLSRVNIAGVSLNVASDGVHFVGPISAATVRDIRGKAGDDAVAITARDWDAYNDTQGDVTDVLIDGVSVIGDDAALVKVIGGVGVKLRRIRAVSLSGTNACAVSVIDDQVGPTDIDQVDIAGVSITLVSASRPALEFAASAGGSISASRVRYAGPSGARLAYAAGNWDTLAFSDVGASQPTTASQLFLIRAVARVLTIARVFFRATDTTAACVFMDTAANVTSTRISGVQMQNGRSLLDTQVGSVTPSVLLSDVNCVGTSRLSNVTTTVDMTVTNIGGSFVNEAIYVNSAAALTLRGSGVRQDNGWAGVQRAGTPVINVFNQDWPTHLARVTKVAQGRCTNIDTGLAVGGGLVICDGSSWKNLYTGATY